MGMAIPEPDRICHVCGQQKQMMAATKIKYIDDELIGEQICHACFYNLHCPWYLRVWEWLKRLFSGNRRDG